MLAGHGLQLVAHCLCQRLLVALPPLGKFRNGDLSEQGTSDFLVGRPAAARRPCGCSCTVSSRACLVSQNSQTRIPGDAYSETPGAALTDEMLKYYNLAIKDTKGYNWGNIMSLKAVFTHMFLNDNIGVRMIRLWSRNIVNEKLDKTAMSDLNVVCTETLFVHSFTVQARGPGTQNKQRGRTARWGAVRLHAPCHLIALCSRQSFRLHAAALHEAQVSD